MSPRLRSCFVALTVLVALTGCGDDDDPATDDGEDAVDVGSDPADGDDGSGGDDPATGGGGEVDDDEPDDGAAPDDDAYVERAVADLVGASDLEPEMARCIATAVLDAAGGAQALQDAGLDEESWFATSESFEALGLPADDDAVDGLADGLGECGDGHELLFTTAGSEVSDAVRQCVTDAVDEAEVRRQLARSIIRSEDGPEEGEVDVFALVAGCEDESLPG